MRFGKYLSSLTKPELENLIENCNFSEEEEVIFKHLSKQKSIREISIKMNISEPTVNRRIKNLRIKVERVCENG